MKILGFTDSITTCSCGKCNLKGVYVVETEDGETLNLGSSCVKKNWDLTQSEFKQKVSSDYMDAFKLAKSEWTSSQQYKLTYIENTFEYGTIEFKSILSKNRKIDEIRKMEVNRIREKFMISKKNLAANHIIAPK